MLIKVFRKHSRFSGVVIFTGRGWVGQLVAGPEKSCGCIVCVGVVVVSLLGRCWTLICWMAD